MATNLLYQQMLQSAMYGHQNCWTSTSAYTYGINVMSGVGPSTKKVVDKVATSLDWLDKRVEEMRVKL